MLKISPHYSYKLVIKYVTKQKQEQLALCFARFLRRLHTVCPLVVCKEKGVRRLRLSCAPASLAVCWGRLLLLCQFSLPQTRDQPGSEHDLIWSTRQLGQGSQENQQIRSALNSVESRCCVREQEARKIKWKPSIWSGEQGKENNISWVQQRRKFFLGGWEPWIWLGEPRKEK
jgi:hypothetical protein